MEVDVARRVDQVELELLALVVVPDRDRARLDRDPALALELHEPFTMNHSHLSASFQ